MGMISLTEKKESKSVQSPSKRNLLSCTPGYKFLQILFEGPLPSASLPVQWQTYTIKLNSLYPLRWKENIANLLIIYFPWVIEYIDLSFFTKGKFCEKSDFYPPRKYENTLFSQSESWKNYEMWTQLAKNIDIFCPHKELN